MMKYQLMFFVILGVLAGCASSNKVKELDTSLDPKGQVQEGVVGLKDDEAIIQKQTRADDELRVVQWQNYGLEGDLRYEQGMVDWCYQDLSDPRLGGDGELPKLPDTSGMKPAVKVKEELGLVQGNLMVVKTMDFKEKLAAERTYQTTLERMIGEAKQTRGTCERKMSMARIKAGLPGRRYEGKITITPEGRVDQVLQRHEHNLDDAFEIKKDKEKVEGSSSAPAAPVNRLPSNVKEAPSESAIE